MPIIIDISQKVPHHPVFGHFHRSVGKVLVCLGLMHGCMTKDSLVAEVIDPDPDLDGEVMNLCNPSGKVGAELLKCEEQNRFYFARFDEEAKKREPWFNFPTGSWLDSIQLEGKYVFEAVALADAIERLAETPFIEISHEEAHKLTGKDIHFPGRKPFLVRSLVYAKEHGAFNVFEKDSSIYVRHEAEGVPPETESRYALIIWLPFKPKDLFVDCQVFN